MVRSRPAPALPQVEWATLLPTPLIGSTAAVEALGAGATGLIDSNCRSSSGSKRATSRRRLVFRGRIREFRKEGEKTERSDDENKVRSLMTGPLLREELNK